MEDQKIVIYKNEDSEIELKADIQNQTLWLDQKIIAQLFGVKRPAVTKHIGNIFKDGELEEDSVSSKMEHTASDGKTYQKKYYNLDMIIAIGYRVNSGKATQFRI
ncbi:MAG: RhuM family protein [Candidatus Dojkabacteria bacterium]